MKKIRLKIVDSGDPLKLERQKIIAQIMTTKDIKFEQELQKKLQEINRRIYK